MRYRNVTGTTKSFSRVVDGISHFTTTHAGEEVEWDDPVQMSRLGFELVESKPVTSISVTEIPMVSGGPVSSSTDQTITLDSKDVDNFLDQNVNVIIGKIQKFKLSIGDAKLLIEGEKKGKKRKVLLDFLDKYVNRR